MPTYEYKCGKCGDKREIYLTFAEYDGGRGGPVGCPECAVYGCMKRTYKSFYFSMPFGEGYSPTLGRGVQSERDLREGMKIASEEATARTGIPHNFQPVDMRDTETLGITEEGLAADNKARHDRGEATVKVPGLDV